MGAKQGEDIHPGEELQLVLHYWYVLVLLGILGGLAGWAANSRLTPVYEARATLFMNLDLPQEQYYSDTQTDYFLNSAINIIYSAQMIQELAEELSRQEVLLGTGDLQLDRRESRWDLVARNPDPVIAAQISNTWLDLSLARLEEAHEHSLLAAGTATELAVLGGCTTNQEHPICASFSSPEQLQSTIARLQEQYQQEERASRGLNPSLTFELDARASVPSEPILYQRNLMIAAGMGLGLILGWPAMKLLWKRRH